MKILITGGTGLIGNAIKEETQKSNHEIYFMSSKDCDLTNYDQTYIFFEKYKPEYVIHLAANVGGLFKNMNNKINMFESNMKINMNVLEVCYKLKIYNVISCLSTCIFPDKTTYPIDENMIHLGEPHESNYAYAYAKRMLEVQSRAYNEQYGTNYACIIPCNIYGKYDNFNLDDSHVIPALIHKCYIAKQKNEKFIIYGSGKPLRQFIYSNDLAKIIMYLIDNNIKFDKLIISSKYEITIKELAENIAKKFNYDHMIEYDCSKADGQYKKTANIDKLENIINNIEFTDIDIGLSNVIEWFKNNYDNIRK